MEGNEIIKAYGKDFKEMTKRLLVRSNLISEIKAKEEKLKKQNIRIGIKPNLVTCSPAKFGATTHPEIVSGIIEHLKENGVENIVIAEGSWVGDKTSDAFEYCGYNSLSKEYGVEIIDTQKDSYYTADCNGLELDICSCVKGIDFLINVPVLKGHCQTKITCALKNMKGLITNSEKRHFHAMGLHRPIAFLNTHIHQDFIVIDHICGDPDFEEGGSPLVRNCIMTAKDPVLVDAYTAKILGYETSDIDYIGFAESCKVGSADLSKLHIITIEGENCEDLPQTRKILNVCYAVEETESCSACYSMLIGALNRLKNEGKFDLINEKISIGQGYKGKGGKCGIGNCTKSFDFSIPGCPPSEDEIYERLLTHFSK